jgi:hypothetical protein
MTRTAFRGRPRPMCKENNMGIIKFEFSRRANFYVGMVMLTAFYLATLFILQIIIR